MPKESNMNSVFKKTTLFFLITISLTACFNYEDVEITDVRSIKLLDMSAKGLSVESEIKISNPNSFKLSVSKSEFDFYIKGKKLGKASIDGKLKIPANSEEYHKVVLISKSKDMSPNALPILIGLTASGRDKIDFKVDGFIEGKAFLFKRKVNVSHSGIVPLELY